MTKAYKLQAEKIKDLILSMGACFASDRITVDGLPVRWMYRIPEENRADSGWHFYSGNEDQNYANEPDNFGIFDVNTIANYDPSIIPHLGTPAPCAFEKPYDFQSFVQVHDLSFLEDD